MAAQASASTRLDSSDIRDMLRKYGVPEAAHCHIPRQILVSPLRSVSVSQRYTPRFEHRLKGRTDHLYSSLHPGSTYQNQMKTPPWLLTVAV